MQNETRGLIASRFMSFFNTLLYLFVVIQYIVLFVVIRQAHQMHPLPIRVWLLLPLYPGPLVIGLAFRRHLGILRRKELLTAKAARICNDWITVLLSLVYGMLLEFRLLC